MHQSEQIGILRGCLHEISFRAKWNIFILVSGQFRIAVYMIQTEMKLIAGAISVDFISFPISFRVIKYHVNTTRDKIIWEETCVHAFISSKQQWFALNEWAGFFGLPRNEISPYFARDEK